jgi:hypothetical protein
VELSSDAVAAIVAALSGGVVGSLLTAAFAGRQLDKRLTHDRELHDLAELRDVLDDAAVVGAEAMRRVRRIYILVTEDEDEHEHGFEGEELESEELEIEVAALRSMIESHREAHVEFMEAGPAVLLQLHRIILRLDREDEVTQSYLGVYTGIGEFLEALPDDSFAEPDEETADELSDRREDAARAMQEFLDAARARVGVRGGALG